MRGTQQVLGALFAVLEEHTTRMTERIGASEAAEPSLLVQKLIASLPHKYLPAASREDFTGLAVRFLSFVGEGQHRLEMLLHRRPQSGQKGQNRATSGTATATTTRDRGRPSRQ